MITAIPPQYQRNLRAPLAVFCICILQLPGSAPICDPPPVPFSGLCFPIPTILSHRIEISTDCEYFPVIFSDFSALCFSDACSSANLAKFCEIRANSMRHSCKKSPGDRIAPEGFYLAVSLTGISSPAASPPLSAAHKDRIPSWPLPAPRWADSSAQCGWHCPAGPSYKDGWRPHR